jgi:predicted small lipoprotein YifL
MRTILLLLVLALAACGQKGDLFLRENPPPGYKPKAEPYKPAPYPDGTGRNGAPAK